MKLKTLFESLYVYGIVKSSFDLDWRNKGMNGKNVYLINEGNFSALAHECEEKPYISSDPNEIKELIITHNEILDKAMKDFEGVIPLPFNTIIIKKENYSSQENLKQWLKDDKERLEKIWNKIKSKKEYGIRIYYEKDKLQDNKGINRIKEGLKGKTPGLNYLLQEKANSKANEIIQNKISRLKQKFYNDIKQITENIEINTSRIFIDEEKDLLLSVSVLVNKYQIDKTKKFLENSKDFTFHLAGPFAPYSFTEK